MKRLSKFFREWLFLGSVFATISLFLAYIVGVFCFPLFIIWAIYKIVTHFVQ